MNGIFIFLQILGALSIFIYGLKVMSESLQKVTGRTLRRALKVMTANRAVGFFTGLVLTSIIQSSSATTVMLVSFVNAGLITFTQSMAVTIGANIGTTFTAWLVWLFGYEVGLKSAVLAVIGLTFPLLFKRGNTRNTAEFFMGFGLLLIGLVFLRQSVPDLQQNSTLFNLLNYFNSNTLVSYLFFIVAGTIISIILQSSSASATVTMVMLSNGWIEFPQAAAMVLGENIGTTTTANIAALLGNIHAKRAARFHTFFNISGVVWALLFFPFLLQFVDWVQSIFFTNHSSILIPYQVANADAAMHQQRQSIETNGIAMFHTLFNVLNAIIHLSIVPYSAQLIIRLFPTQNKKDETFRLKHLSSGLVELSELNISEAQTEIKKLGILLEKMSGNVALLLVGEVKNRTNLMAKIRQREELSDVLEQEVSNFLSIIISTQITEKASKQVRNMLSIVNDMESIADHLHKIARRIVKISNLPHPAPQELITELHKILKFSHQSIEVMNKNLGFDLNSIDNSESKAIEAEISRLYKQITTNIYDRINSRQSNIEEGILYLDILRSIKKTGDHAGSIMKLISNS
ncbi:MAG: Na/Pi cotransporter family protein [Sphingobacteriales bacterium]|nr:MAG: Na/Pi cotransporter family protein [Sphingobacteriales bacterium]